MNWLDFGRDPPNVKGQRSMNLVSICYFYLINAKSQEPLGGFHQTWYMGCTTRAPLHKTFCQTFFCHKKNSGKSLCKLQWKHFFCWSFLIFAVKNSGKKFYATGPRSGSMTYAPTTNAPARNANVEAYINPDPIPNPNPNPNPLPCPEPKTQSYPWV